MGELETNEELNNEVSLDDNSVVENSENNEIPLGDTGENNEIEPNTETAITEYKEVEKPCVSLTIIGENRLTDAEVFVRRGIRYSIKAFFSAIALTILNLFI